MVPHHEIIINIFIYLAVFLLKKLLWELEHNQHKRMYVCIREKRNINIKHINI